MGNSTGHAKYAFLLYIANDNSYKGELVSSKNIPYWLMAMKESRRGPEYWSFSEQLLTTRCLLSVLDWVTSPKLNHSIPECSKFEDAWVVF